MSEGKEKVAESLKDAREKAGNATGVALVLFAALTASFLGLWSQVGPFRKALAERMRYESRKAGENKRFNDLVGTEVRDTLQMLAFEQNEIARERTQTGFAALPSPVMTYEPVPPSPHPAQTGQECSFHVYIRTGDSQLDVNDPRDLLRCLVKSKLSPYELQKKLNGTEAEIRPILLENTIRGAEESVARSSGHALQRFHLERAIAQKTQFKLFDVEFSVDGFWAWDVWIALCASGVTYLWMVRRGTFMRTRRISRRVSVMKGYAWLSVEASPAGSWPLWLRPLPPGERWTAAANSKRVDLVLDPLGTVCLLMMWVSVILTIAIAVRIAVISSFLISGADGLNWMFALHAGVCCLATGITVGALLDWYLPRRMKHDSSGDVQSNYSAPAISRRAWLLGGGGVLLTTLFYLPRLRDLVFASILHRHPREAMQPRGPRKRKRKLEDSSLQEGFYLGRSGTIYYMPRTRRSRAMAGLNQSELTPWRGPFNLETLPTVHTSALVPFVRTAVADLIPRPHELYYSKLHSQLLDAEISSGELSKGLRTHPGGN